VIFLLGNCGLLDCPAVAIVGSRDHSPYGAEVCRTLATAAARRGIVVISGMARGLDAVGHVAALDAGGGTIGVLGNGLGVVYPRPTARFTSVWPLRDCYSPSFRPASDPASTPSRDGTG
jgi:DNA processing protein